MKEFIFNSYEFFTAIIPFIILFIMYCPAKKDKHLSRKSSVCAIWMLAVYVAAVFHFTGAGTIYDLLRFQLTIRSDQINLLPFSQQIDTIGYLQNVLLFLPLGFLLPFIWPRFCHIKNIFLAGFLFSFCIEFSQLWNNRCTDVDDLLLNTLGAILGFLLYQLVKRICRLSENHMELFTCGPSFYIGLMFLGRVLLFHEMGMAKLLYGF